MDAQLAAVEASKVDISLLELDYAQILEAVKEAERDSRRLRRSNEVLIRDQKALREKIAQLESSATLAKAQGDEHVAELEHQVRDLTFFTRTKAQVAASPLKAELEGGSVVVRPGGRSGQSGGGGGGSGGGAASTSKPKR